MTNEVDYNHPDYLGKQNFSIQTFVDEGEVLYICAQNPGNFPPTKWRNYCESLQEKFKEALPNTTIIVGAYDLKFTTISRKQAFKGKLNGQI